MTINIDSVWVLLGIGITLGAGGYLGVVYAILAIRAGRYSGIWIADHIVMSVINMVSRGVAKWKK